MTDVPILHSTSARARRIRRDINLTAPVILMAVTFVVGYIFLFGRG